MNNEHSVCYTVVLFPGEPQQQSAENRIASFEDQVVPDNRSTTWKGSPRELYLCQVIEFLSLLYKDFPGDI